MCIVYPSFYRFLYSWRFLFSFHFYDSTRWRIDRYTTFCIWHTSFNGIVSVSFHTKALYLSVIWMCICRSDDFICPLSVGFVARIHFTFSAICVFFPPTSRIGFSIERFFTFHSHCSILYGFIQTLASFNGFGSFCSCSYVCSHLLLKFSFISSR